LTAAGAASHVRPVTGTSAPRDPARLHERRFSAGTVIFREGDPGEDMFVILAGRVRLTLGSGGHETVIGTLQAGAFFGEMTLLGGVPRSATAVAATDTTLLRIGRDVFAIMMQDDLEVVFRMLETIRGRLAASDERFETLAARIERARVTAELLRRAVTGDHGAPVTGSAGDLESACGASAAGRRGDARRARRRVQPHRPRGAVHDRRPRERSPPCRVAGARACPGPRLRRSAQRKSFLSMARVKLTKTSSRLG
jgi:CRP-like cAMP-binding protein